MSGETVLYRSFYTFDMAELLVAAVLVGLLLVTELFFTTLAGINLRYQREAVDENGDWMRAELGIDDPDRALAYERIGTGLGLLRSWTVLAVVLLVLFSGLFAAAVETIGALDSTLLESAVFVGGVVVFLRVALAPFDIVETFVVEEAFGFNEQSLLLWVRDWLLKTLVAAALVVPFGVAVVWFVETAPLWPVAGWLLAVAAVLAVQVLLPRVILPLFYEFEPLEDGPLRDAVEDVFETAGYRTENVYEMNASSRSGHSNAFFAGFGPAKRVVLFDTLTESMDTEAIKSVLAHELAHWREGHIWRFIALAAVRFGAVFAALGLLVESGVVFDAVPAPETAYVGLFVGLLFVWPVNRLTSPVENYFSLGYERDADAYAIEIVGGEPLARALSDLSENNLSMPFDHPWYETFHSDHPPKPERIRRARELDDDTTTSAENPASDAKLTGRGSSR